MSRADAGAVRRVKEWLDGSASSGFTNIKGRYVDVADLRVVLALAQKQARREAVESLFAAPPRALRKPLPRRKAGR